MSGASGTADDRWSRASRVVCALLIVTGVAVRIRLYREASPLSLDESMLALNVAMRGWRQLTEPLALEQTAPVVFLWLTRLVVLIGGVGERALRLVPFVSGLAVIPIVAVIAVQLRAPRAAWLAAALAALAPLAIHFALTFKQYSSDAAVTGTVLVVALDVAHSPERVRGWWTLAIVALFAPFLAAPAVFVSAASVVGLWVAPGIAQSVRARTRVALIALLAVSAGTINYLLFQRATVSNAYMQRYWSSAFPGVSLASTAGLARELPAHLLNDLLVGTSVPAGRVWHIWMATLLGAGVWWLARRRRVWALLLVVGPIVAVVVAATARRYPLAPRTLVFLAPLVIVLAALGVQYLADRATEARRSVAAFWLAAVTVLPVLADARTQWRAPHVSGPELRSALRAISSQVDLGEPIYLFSRGVPVWLFYSTDWAHPDLARLDRMIDFSRQIGPNSGNAPHRPHVISHEGWALVSHDRERTELVGIATGMEDLLPGATGLKPDSGWATNEAARINAVASRRMWIFFTTCHAHCEKMLADTLGASGGVLGDTLYLATTTLYEYTGRRSTADSAAVGRTRAR
jgi:4-amino-4-deoxy-L-arabinose transferase-like glycosyltransferase